MSAVKLAVRVDHLRFDPDSEPHTKALYVIDQPREAVRKFSGIHIPVSQSLCVVLPCAKPAVVYHEQLHPKGCRLFGKLHLFLALNVKIGGIPGIIQNGKLLSRKGPGHQVIALEAVQALGHGSQSAGGISAVYGGCAQGLSGIQLPGKIGVAHTDQDIGVLIGCGLRHHLEVAGIGQQSEIHVAGLLSGIPVQDEAGICHMAGVAPEAFIYFFSG